MINFEGIETKTLVAAHNACATLLGSTPVNKFKDRATAERRTAFLLSQVKPDKRPAPFTEAAPAAAEAPTKGSVKPPPAKRMTEAEADEQYRKDSAAIRGEPLKTKDATPTPPVADKVARWRKAKKTPASKVAYRPRAGSLQDRMYKLLTQEGERGFGCTVEAFCADMVAAGAKPTMTKLEQTWSNLGYLFVSQKGYGLEFDGERIWLLVPKDERDAVPAKKGG